MITECIKEILNENNNITVYHGDDYDTTSINPKLMNNGNNQEGIGIYFGPYEVAKTYGKNIISINIDKNNFVDSNSFVEDIIDFDKILKMVNMLYEIDNEAFYYYLTDWGVDIEVEDIRKEHIEFITTKIYSYDIGILQVELAKVFGVENFVESWNECIQDIHGLYGIQSGFYAVINTNYKINGVN